VRAQLPRKNLAGWAWFFAFYFFPVGVYPALYAAGAITRGRAIRMSLAVGVVQVAYIVCVALTDHRPQVQGWVLHACLLFYLLMGVLLYREGARLHLWPRYGIRMWRVMGTIGVTLWIVYLFGNLLMLVFPGLMSLE
jgi:hypothetical protein